MSNPLACRLKERGAGLMRLCMVDQDTHGAMVEVLSARKWSAVWE